MEGALAYEKGYLTSLSNPAIKLYGQRLLGCFMRMVRFSVDAIFFLVHSTEDPRDVL